MTGRARPAAARALVLASLILILAGTAACGEEGVSDKGTAGKSVEKLTGVVPSELLGLTATEEDVSQNLASTGRTYVDGAALYSLRSEDVVQATIQVLRFNEDAKIEDPDFRGSLVAQIGGATPDVGRLGKDRVYFVRGVKQRLSLWFRDDHLFVLSTRDEYDKPRTLLRSALEIQP